MPIDYAPGELPKGYPATIRLVRPGVKSAAKLIAVLLIDEDILEWRWGDAGSRLGSVIPIHELLARIRHDAEFGNGQFEIGYLDRFDGTVHRGAMCEITLPKGQCQTFALIDETGQLRRIPFHRVREIHRNGRLIWQRPVKSAIDPRATCDTVGNPSAVRCAHRGTPSC